MGKHRAGGGAKQTINETTHVNPRTTAILGWVYVVARFLYPICYGFYGVFNNLVEVVQQDFLVHKVSSRTANGSKQQRVTDARWYDATAVGE